MDNQGNAPTNCCPMCESGRLTVYSTHPDKSAGIRVRYMKCQCCGYSPSQPSIVPLAMAPLQTRRRIPMQRVSQSRLF
jgi:hypothetical protein